MSNLKKTVTEVKMWDVGDLLRWIIMMAMLAQLN